MYAHLVEWMEPKDRAELDQRLQATTAVGQASKWDPATWGTSPQAQAALSAAATHARVTSPPHPDGHLGPMWDPPDADPPAPVVPDQGLGDMWDTPSQHAVGHDGAVNAGDQ